jgi:hypothetical protein
MANKLQSTGDIKISQAASALGRSNKLSDYYADVIGTDNFVDNPAVDEESFGLHPNTGSPISLGDLYGDANVDRFVISSNQIDLNLRTYLVSQGWDQTSRAFIIINSGVYITSSSARLSGDIQVPALLIEGEWPNGLFITNNGNILGHGGHGVGRSTSSAYMKKGSCAIKITSATLINFENNGVIAGGGGGGAASNSNGASANSGGGGGAGGGNGGAGAPNSGNKTHNGSGGAGASTIGSKGADGSGASSDVRGKGGGAGGSGGGYKNAT